jgi:hypothetical protein
MSIQTVLHEAERRRTRHMDAQLSFCRNALDQGYTSASQGELESASRLLWLAEDAACSMKPILKNFQNAAAGDQYRRQLGFVLKDLCDLKQVLCISEASS